MATRRAGAVLVAAAGRGLYEGEEARPGRSDLAYMRHKYSPLDSRIIIITAAILLFLITILFLNFFIRWALRRFFLARSDPKAINLNKGLSKRQIEALPSFIYSSSKPLRVAPPPSGHPIFYGPFTLNPISSHFPHALYPLSRTSTKVGSIDYNAPTKLEVNCKPGDLNTPSQLPSTPIQKVVIEPQAKVLSLEGNTLASTHIDVVGKIDPPIKFGSLEVDHALDITYTSIQKEEVVNNACTSEALVQNSHNEVQGNVTIDCKKNGDMTKHCDETPSSSSPCPICLFEFVDGETIRVLHVCQHYFHIGCIDLWLTKSSSCPACRANLLNGTISPISQSPLRVQIVTSTPH